MWSLFDFAVVQSGDVTCVDESVCVFEIEIFGDLQICRKLLNANTQACLHSNEAKNESACAINDYVHVISHSFPTFQRTQSNRVARCL